jgi:uncharacterized protein YgbK (DUF1537 family)
MLSKEEIMHPYLIIADDFTGSNDSGIQLVRHHYPTHVQIRKASAPLASGVSLVLDTESRNMEEKEAEQVLKESLASLHSTDFSTILKKIDSTLRGNIASEVEASASHFAAELIIVATAFPDLGRTCKHGVVYVHGRRLGETEAFRDPRKPVAEDDLVRLFAKRKKTILLDVEQIRSGSFVLSDAEVVVCDAEKQSDLSLVVAWAASLKQRILYVGSAGLAQALVEVSRPSKPALALVASLSETTKAQVEYARDHGAACIVLKVDDLLGQKDLQCYLDQAATAFAKKEDVMLVVSSVLDRTEFDRSLSEGKRQGMDDGQIADLIREKLGNLGKQLLDSHSLSGLFLTGGDTAFGLLSLLGVHEVDIKREVVLGLPLMQVVGSTYDGLGIVTKAGAFGNKDAISYALRVLRQHD